MSWWPKLRPHQLELLRRIADGSRPVTSREPASARTVYALRTRRLVTTPRVAGVWTAVITDAGRYYLEHGEYVGAEASRLAPTRQPLRARPPRRRRAVDRDATAEDVPAPEELIKRLETRGRVMVPKPSAEVRAAWRRVVDAVLDEGPVRDGYQLRFQGRDRGDVVVDLVHTGHAYQGNAEDQAATVPTPDVAEDELPIVRELRRRPGQLSVSESSLDRALRLVQALAVEAQRRGYRVAVADGPGAGFLIEVRGRAHLLAMSEEYDAIDAPDVEDPDDPNLYPWQRIPKRRRQVPSGRLVLELADSPYRYSGRTRRWADRKRWRLEDKLGDALAAVEARTEIDEQDERAAERAKVERQRQWELAMERARARFAEAHRINALKDQLKRWRQAQEIRHYAAVQASWHEGEQAEALTEWICWMLDYADRIDPLLPAPAVPVPPVPDREDLRPYLTGWSPYGPD